MRHRRERWRGKSVEVGVGQSLEKNAGLGLAVQSRILGVSKRAQMDACTHYLAAELHVLITDAFAQSRLACRSAVPIYFFAITANYCNCTRYWVQLRIPTVLD